MHVPQRHRRSGRFARESRSRRLGRPRGAAARRAPAPRAGLAVATLRVLPARRAPPCRPWTTRGASEPSACRGRPPPALPNAAPRPAHICQQVQEQPVTALLAAAEEADLLVLGSRGLGGVTGFIVGSVALAVVARTERPVVLVRSGERVADDHPKGGVVLGLDLERPDSSPDRFRVRSRVSAPSEPFTSTDGVCRPPTATAAPSTST